MDIKLRQWYLYEKGLDYMRTTNLISITDRSWKFYAGKQWEGIETGGEELPFENIIKPMIKHKVSTVSQNNMVANYSDLHGGEELQPVYEKLNIQFSASWERANMDMNLWQTMREAAVTGDGFQYYGTGDVADIQRINTTEIFLGNENEPDIQKQPYIILRERLQASEVRRRAKENGLPDEEIEMIKPDSDTTDMIGNKHEVGIKDGKITCLIFLEKIDGIVHVSKCTRNVVYEPDRPIATTLPSGEMGKGLTLYPIIKVSWEDYPNSARGLSEVEQLIPNQLEINKTLARQSLIIKLTAYPRTAYDPMAITNPEALTKVGVPIEVQTGGASSINQMISYMNPAQISNVPMDYAHTLINTTQELGGAGETAMGNINPNRVAASAIIAIRDQAALPLNEQIARKSTAVEDMARLWIELWSVYNPNGFDVQVQKENPETGEKQTVTEHVTKEELDMITPNVRIDTSQDNPWTKEAEQNFLDSLLEKQLITFEEYVELCPEHGIVPKNKLLDVLARRQQQMPTEEMDGMEEPIEEELPNDNTNKIMQ